MLSTEARVSRTIAGEPPTRAESLISAIQSRLGNHYCLDSHAKTVSANGTGLLLYREVSFMRRGFGGSASPRWGAYALFTLITDSQHIREIEQQSKTREMLSTPPTIIDGWMPQNGSNLVNQIVGPDDIPADVRTQLEGVPYFATAERFAYISQGLSARTFLVDQLEQTTRS
jgi:hypothetical protein